MGENADRDGIQVLAELKDGKEYGDPTPVAPPVGIRKSPTMAERIQMMVRRELSDRAEALGMETFEEADDFDIEDDPLDPSTPYEQVFDPVENAARERLRTDDYKAKVQARYNEYRVKRGLKPEGAGDGDVSVDEGGSKSVDPGARKPGKVDESDAKSKPGVSGSRVKAGKSDPDVEE